MAMTTCPNCGQLISDKATTCVHCGYVLKTPEKKHCPECGQELEEGVTVCPNCGCPVEDIQEAEKQAPESAQNTSPQQVEVTGVRVNKKRLKVVAIVAVILVAVLVIGGISYSNIQKANKIAAEEKYASDLQSISTLMLGSAAEAETCGNLIKKVWSNAIFKDDDPETDEYTQPDGYFIDFNDALINLFADSDFSSKILDIKNSQSLVSTQMKDMKNPPEAYEDAYKELSELYSAYNTFVDYVENPTGSLQTFNENFGNYDSNVSSSYNDLEIYFEN